MRSYAFKTFLEQYHYLEEKNKHVHFHVLPLTCKAVTMLSVICETCFSLATRDFYVLILMEIIAVVLALDVLEELCSFLDSINIFKIVFQNELDSMQEYRRAQSDFVTVTYNASRGVLHIWHYHNGDCNLRKARNSLKKSHQVV